MKRARQGSDAVQFCLLTTPAIPELSSLMGALLPVRFPPSFFNQMMASPQFVHLAYQDGILVGAVIATATGDPPQFCIAGLCVRPTYRGNGIGLALVERVLRAIIESASKTKAISEKENPHDKQTTEGEIDKQTTEDEKVARLCDAQARDEKEPISNSKTCVTLHVQCGNSSAISVYERAGFVTQKTIRNHYPRLADPHCFLMSKPI